MKNITNKIKQIGRKYALPVVLAGALALSSYGCGQEKSEQLPIHSEVRETHQKEINVKLGEMVNSYKSTLDSARNKFNEYIAQRDTFTVEEQKEVEGLYGRTSNLGESIRDYAEDNGKTEYTDLNFLDEDTKLYSLLNKNLYGIDGGTPELEKVLKNSGIDCLVESRNTGFEGGLGTISLLAGLMFGINYVPQIVNKLRRKLRRR